MWYILLIAGGVVVIVLAWVLQRGAGVTKWRTIDPAKLDKARMKKTTDLQRETHKPMKSKSNKQNR